MLRFAFLFALMIALASPFYAATTLTLSPNLATFQGALTGLQMITFDIPQEFNDYSGIPLTIGGASFANIGGQANGDLYVTNYAPFTMGSGRVLALSYADADPRPYVRVTFPTAVSGIAFNTKGYDAASFFIVTPDSNTIPVNGVPGNSSAPIWIGVTSDVPFNQIMLSTTGGRGIIDNFQYGTANVVDPPPPSETPEIATLLMIGIGLLTLRVGRRYFNPTPA